MSSDHPLISIIIVTWNSINHLPNLFNSISLQTFKNFDIIVIDNGSNDNSVQWLTQNYPQAKIIRNNINAGFAIANNQGIKLSESEYVLLCNTDIVMSPDFIELLYKKISSDKNIGAVGGKLLKPGADLNRHTNSDIIDSAGITIYANRRAVDRGENQKSAGQYNESCEVFGVSAALALYRRSALEKVAYKNEYFDESFFSYKEDVDLAWRLRLAGYDSYIVASALAIHHRGASMTTDLSDTGTIKNRKNKSKKVNYLSYRNHLYLLAKNEGLLNTIHHPKIAIYEAKKFIYILFKEPKSLKAIADLFANLSTLKDKRRAILKIARFSNKELINWFE